MTVAAKLVVGNWKMNTSVYQAEELCLAIRERTKEVDKSKVTIVICPPFISILLVKDILKESGISIGSQNTFIDTSGAFTGEVSASMLSDICDFVIIGHSERRRIFLETDDLINKKMQAAFNVGLKPILCVGETLQERDSHSSESVIQRQLETALDGIADISSVIVAYEPIWAIGTGKPATPQIINDVVSSIIRPVLNDNSNKAISEKNPILYGGSVTPENVGDFLNGCDIQGVLVGGASINPIQFSHIVQLTAE